MTIQYKNAAMERMVDKNIKKLPYPQTKQQFIDAALDHYSKHLIATRIIK
tara:strand:- start:1031 stop:1180 length:150 start_codon:yes stop_codon:yes gene_type:complete